MKTASDRTVAVEKFTPLSQPTIKKNRRRKQIETPDGGNIPRSCMNRLIREIIQGYHTDFRITEEGTFLLHAETERYLRNFFTSCAVVAHRAGRDTIIEKDAEVVKTVRRLANC